jgi:hypothetical protein
VARAVSRLLSASALAVVGCAHGNFVASTPPIVTTAQGFECQRLGPVHGLATADENRDYGRELYSATQDALPMARALGATHVVLDREEGAPTLMRLSGYAYRCP